jgi:hypothetical protein
VDGEDVGVLEAGGELDLALEAVRPERGGGLGQQHLERHGPVVLEIASEIDGGHPAAPELALDEIALG